MKEMTPRVRGIVRAFLSKFSPRPLSEENKRSEKDFRSRPHTSKIDAMLLEILKNTADGMYDDDQVRTMLRISKV